MEAKDCQEIKGTLAHSLLRNMGGLYCQENGIRFPLDRVPVRPATRYLLLPRITEEDIEDTRAKTTGLQRQLPCSKSYNLSFLSYSQEEPDIWDFSTQLEALTLVFAVCGVGTYAVLLVQAAKRASRHCSDETRPRTLSAPAFRVFQKTQDSFWAVLTNEKNDTENKVESGIANDNIPTGTSQTTHMAIPVPAVMSAGIGCSTPGYVELRVPYRCGEAFSGRIAIVLSLPFR